MATVNDIYKMTKDLMFEKGSSKIYDDFLISNVNRLLVELFEENNADRVFHGKEKLESPQIVASRSDVLTYEDDIVLNILPLGLAAQFYIDDDLNKYSIFATMYNNARTLNQKIVSRKKLNAS